MLPVVGVLRVGVRVVVDLAGGKLEVVVPQIHRTDGKTEFSASN